MRISNICIGTLSVLWLGLASNPAIGFTLDLFSETDNDATTDLDPNVGDLYILGNFNSSDIPYQGQQVSINQNSAALTGLLYDSVESDNNLNTNNVVGGSRHLKITTTLGTNEASLSTGTSQSTGVLNLNTNSATTSVGTIVWNGSDSINFSDIEADAALNIDLEADGDGDDSIGIEIEFADQGGNLALTLYDGTNTHTDTQPIPVVNGSTSETIYYNFSTYQAESVDINNIQYISAQLSGPSASDIDLRFIETAKEVPFEFSPSLSLVISSAFFGWNIAKRNKSKQALR